MPKFLKKLILDIFEAVNKVYISQDQKIFLEDLEKGGALEEKELKGIDVKAKLTRLKVENVDNPNEIDIQTKLMIHQHPRSTQKPDLTMEFGDMKFDCT